MPPRADAIGEFLEASGKGSQKFHEDRLCVRGVVVFGLLAKRWAKTPGGDARLEIPGQHRGCYAYGSVSPFALSSASGSALLS